jgi:hypothetical protein
VTTKNPVFTTENSVLTTEHGVPHISLVFREMWDTTAVNHNRSAPNRHLRSKLVVSHISRKTSEMWGTPCSVVRTEFSVVKTEF